MSLISREAAIDALCKAGCGSGHCGISCDDVKAIEQLPTIERVGKWIIRDNPGTGWYSVTCSECGEDVTSTIPMIGFFPNAKPLWDYCPWCGAKQGDGDE